MKWTSPSGDRHPSFRARHAPVRTLSLVVAAVLLTLHGPACALAFADEPLGMPDPGTMTDEATDNPYSENCIDTLHHRPAAGQLRIDTGLDLNPRDREDQFAGSLTGGSASASATTRTASAGLSLYALYGLSDVWFVGVSDRLGFVSKRTGQSGDPAGVGIPATAAGLSSPTVSLDWRFLGGLHDTLFGHVGLAYTPSFGGVRLAEPGQTGSLWSANHVVGAHLDIEALLGALEVVGGGSLAGHSTGTFTASTPESSYTSSPYLSGTVNLQARWHFLERLYVGAAMWLYLGNDISYNYPHAVATAGTLTEPTHRVTTSAYATVSGELGLRVASGTVVSVAYSHAGYTRTVPVSSSVAALRGFGYTPTAGRVEYTVDGVQLSARFGW